MGARLQFYTACAPVGLHVFVRRLTTDRTEDRVRTIAGRTLYTPIEPACATGPVRESVSSIRRSWRLKSGRGVTGGL